VGAAIRSGKPAVVRDTLTDRNFDPWRAEAQKRNFRSVLGLPLISFGALCIYATEPNAFDDEEINLLLGLANDLAYVLWRCGAGPSSGGEAALKESEQELRRLGVPTPDHPGTRAPAGGQGITRRTGSGPDVFEINLVAIETSWPRISTREGKL